MIYGWVKKKCIAYALKKNIENWHAYQLLIFPKKLIKLGLKSMGLLLWNSILNMV